MEKGQLRGMQSLTRKSDAVARAAPVSLVADERMADVLEMHADLMGAARLQPAFDERRAAVALEHAVRGARRLAAVRDRHARAHARVAPHRSVDRAARRRIALHHGEINPTHAAAGELLGEL